MFSHSYKILTFWLRRQINWCHLLNGYGNRTTVFLLKCPFGREKWGAEAIKRACKSCTHQTGIPLAMGRKIMMGFFQQRSASLRMTASSGYSSAFWNTQILRIKSKQIQEDIPVMNQWWKMEAELSAAEAGGFINQWGFCDLFSKPCSCS